MTEIHRVLDIQGKRVVLGFEKSAACFGCHSQNCGVNRRFVSAENPSGFSLIPGQLVETEVSPGSALGQALPVLVPPVLGFALFFALIGRLFPGAGDPARAAGGILGLFGSAFALYRLRLRFPPKTTPKIVRILDKTGGLCPLSPSP
jgi:sigma-E factor negative regulatory protein RseC